MQRSMELNTFVFSDPLIKKKRQIRKYLLSDMLGFFHAITKHQHNNQEKVLMKAVYVVYDPCQTHAAVDDENQYCLLTTRVKVRIPDMINTCSTYGKLLLLALVVKNCDEDRDH